VLRPVQTAELAAVRTGTAAAPEDGALVTLAVAGFGPAGPALQLSGPGTGGPRELGVTGLPDGFAAARRELTSQFPAGADFLLVAPDGSIAGLPRTTQARSLEKEAVLWATPVCGAGWTPSSRPSASSGPAASGRRG
jgi:alpha-D-ribose 1-methylphosphonate 5-triphosphate synthase subunit PhnH